MELVVFAGTYNCFQIPSSTINLSECFGSDTNHESIDIYFFTLQELVTVDNTTKKPLNIDYACAENWKDGLEKFINSKRTSTIELVEFCYLGGTVAFLYIRSNLKELIKSESLFKEAIYCSHSRSTIKGAVAIRFSLLNCKDSKSEVSFAFLGCHLSADQDKDNCTERVKELEKLCNHTLGSLKIDNHDFITFVGDLNFRVYMPRDRIINYVKDKNWNAILAYDQLTLERKKGILPGFYEGLIQFPPTYKYVVDTDTINTSEPLSKLLPAYTDRVVYRGSHHVDPSLFKYTSGNIKNSDHRPVHALIHLNIKNIHH